MIGRESHEKEGAAIDLKFFCSVHYARMAKMEQRERERGEGGKY